MSNRAAWGAVALLILAAPVLVFPALLGQSGAGMVAVLAAVVMTCAAGLVWGFGRLPLYVGGLAAMAIFGARAIAVQAETIDHFAALALGLAAMGTVAVWCRTRERLALAALVFVVCGASAVGIGFRSVAQVHTAKAFFGKPTGADSESAPLPLTRLHDHTFVNRNALAAVALMVLPVAAAIAAVPFVRSGLRLPIQFAGLVSAFWLFTVVVIMQSRSAWLAAACLAWLLARRFLTPTVWWLTAAMGLLVVPTVIYALGSDHPRVVELLASGRSRIEIWEQGLAALRSSPWTGIGLDFYRYSGYSPVLVWPNIIVGRPHAHNLFLQTALDVGLIGLAAYLAVTASVLRRAYQLAVTGAQDRWVRSVGVAAGLSVLSVQVYGLMDAVALGTKAGVFQWLACGLALAAWRLHTRSGTQ